MIGLLIRNKKIIEKLENSLKSSKILLNFKYLVSIILQYIKNLIFNNKFKSEAGKHLLPCN